jgi:transcriptional regulator with XRE-family HTH domain
VERPRAQGREALMILLRQLLGDALRHARLRQQRTLREVSAAARVSLGYLSEVERGQKEASSELLSSICDALDVRLADVLREVSESLDLAELTRAPVERSMVSVREPLVVTKGRVTDPAHAHAPVVAVSAVGAELVSAVNSPALATPVTYAA